MIKAANELASLGSTTTITNHGVTRSLLEHCSVAPPLPFASQKSQLLEVDEDEYTTNNHVQRVRNTVNNLASKGSLGSLSIVTSSMNSPSSTHRQFNGMSRSNYASNTYSSSPSSHPPFPP
uniref:Uncharacterized protein n=1 Tax=Ditylenchus dipsaci TaxID=166011 RepID=A0A915EKC6_9BILA